MDDIPDAAVPLAALPNVVLSALVASMTGGNGLISLVTTGMLRVIGVVGCTAIVFVPF
jgi:hypothetical protein